MTLSRPKGDRLQIPTPPSVPCKRGVSSWVTCPDRTEGCPILDEMPAGRADRDRLKRKVRSAYLAGSERVDVLTDRSLLSVNTSSPKSCGPHSAKTLCKFLGGVFLQKLTKHEMDCVELVVPETKKNDARCGHFLQEYELSEISVSRQENPVTVIGFLQKRGVS